MKLIKEDENGDCGVCAFSGVLMKMSFRTPNIHKFVSVRMLSIYELQGIGNE